MKLSFISVAALAILTTAPALAQMQGNHDHGQMQRHAPQQQRVSYHEGQNWRGHRLHKRNGHWGYYQPRNGSQVFISIPL